MNQEKGTVPQVINKNEMVHSPCKIKMKNSVSQLKISVLLWSDLTLCAGLTQCTGVKRSKVDPFVLSEANT